MHCITLRRPLVGARVTFLAVPHPAADASHGRPSEMQRAALRLCRDCDQAEPKGGIPPRAPLPMLQWAADLQEEAEDADVVLFLVLFAEEVEAPAHALAVVRVCQRLQAHRLVGACGVMPVGCARAAE